jgi:SNF2 family DNA or RNA helicase
MVESTNTRAAEMCSRLHGVNRWCITGTPLHKSVSGELIVVIAT